MLLATGEQISISLCAMAIEALGYPVISLTGWQAGMLTNSAYGSARIKRIRTDRIQTELDAGRSSWWPASRASISMMTSLPWDGAAPTPRRWLWPPPSMQICVRSTPMWTRVHRRSPLGHRSEKAGRDHL